MTMMKVFRRFFKVIYLYIKETISDILYVFVIIKKMFRNERVVDPEKFEMFKDQFRNLSAKEILKTSSGWITVIIFTGIVGWYLASQYYQVQCNNFIIENYAKNMSTAVTNYSQMFNFS